MSLEPKKNYSATVSGRSVGDFLKTVADYTDSLNSVYTEDDVPRLIREFRAESKAEAAKEALNSGAILS